MKLARLARERLQIGTDMVHIITNTGDELFSSINTDDLERPSASKMGVLAICLPFLSAAHT